jgi:hypothetical protein
MVIWLTWGIDIQYDTQQGGSMESRPSGNGLNIALKNAF